MAARIARGLGLLDPPDPSAEESAQWGIAPPPPPPGAGPAPESTPPSPATLATAAAGPVAGGSPLSAITQAEVDKINRAREAKGVEPIDLGDLAQATSDAAPLTGSVVAPTSMIGNRPAVATSTGEITNDQGQPIQGPHKPSLRSQIREGLIASAESPLRGLGIVENASRIPKVTPALEKTGEFLGEAARPVGEAFGSVVQPSAPGQAPSQAQVVGGNVAKAVVKGSVPTTGLDIALAAAPFAGDAAEAARAGARATGDTVARIGTRALEGTAPTLDVARPVGEFKPSMRFPREVGTGEPAMVGGGAEPPAAGGSETELERLLRTAKFPGKEAMPPPEDIIAGSPEDMAKPPTPSAGEVPASAGDTRGHAERLISDTADLANEAASGGFARKANSTFFNGAGDPGNLRFDLEETEKPGRWRLRLENGHTEEGTLADLKQWATDNLSTSEQRARFSQASGGSAAPPPPTPPAGDVAAPPPAGTPPPATPITGMKGVRDSFTAEAAQKIRAGESMAGSGIPEQFAEAAFHRGYTSDKEIGDAMRAAARVQNANPGDLNAALNEALNNQFPPRPSPTSTGTVPPGSGAPPNPPPPVPPPTPPVPPAGPPSTSPAATTLHDLFGVETPVPQLTRWQQALNSLNRISGRTPDEPIAAGAFKVLREGRQNIDAQANRFGAVASQIVKEGGFDLDASGRITNLPGNPTIQDLAARLPEFEGSLTPAQLQAMRDLQAETKPFADALTQQLQDSEARSRYDKPFADLTPEQQATVAKNAAIASRADVQDGGFYLPRGRADLEGADAASGGGRGGGIGGKKGFERTATFESMGQGIDQGYKYSPFGDSMQAYARDAGNRTLDSYISDYFKNVTDENGNKLAQTAADRVNPGLRDRVQALRGQIAGKLDTLARQEARGGAQDAAQRRLEGLLKGVEGQVQRKLDQIDATGATYGHTDEAVIRAEAELGVLDKMANRVAGAVNTAADTGTATAVRANTTDASLTKLRSDFNDISGDWAMAKKKAMQTPRGQGTIHDFSGLQGYSFPDEVSNAANKYIDQMKPPSGALSGVVKTVTAVNNLLRGVNATLDVSFLGVQGNLGLFHDPAAYAKAMEIAARSMGNRDALGAFLRDFDQKALTAGLPTSRDWAAAGMRFGGRDTEFQLGTGLGNPLQRVPGVGQAVNAADRSFGYFGDTLRSGMAQDAFKMNVVAKGVTDTAEKTALMKDIATGVNNETGWSRGRLGGEVGQLAAFAPRFIQAQLELITRAATDWHTLDGDMARQALTRFMGFGTLVTLGANTALGNGPGNDQFDWWSPMNGGKENPNFMRIRVAGHDASVFGSWDTLMKGVLTAASGDPVGAARYLARSKASPLVSTAWDLYKGSNVVGQSTNDPMYWLNRVLPFSVQNPSDLVGSGLGVIGVKGNPLSFSEQRDQLARQTFNGKGYDQLDYGQRKQVDDKAKTQGIASSQPPSQLQVQGDAAKQTFASQDTDTANAFKAGTLNQRLADALHDTSMQRLGSSTLQNGYYDAAGSSPQSDFAKRFSTLMDGYQAQVVKDTNNQIDWQTTKAGQAKFVAGLPNTPGKDGAPSDRQLFQSYLDYAEANKSPLQQQVDTYNQAREAAGYYEPKADTAALDKAHPDLDVQGWYLGGGYQTRDGPFAPSLQTVGAVDKALQMVTDQGLANRPVKLAGLPRPVNENDGTQDAFKATEKLIDTYQNKVVPQNAEKVAQQLYGKSFASLKPTGPQSQESVVNEIHRQVMLGTPQLDAAMAWFGASDSLGSSAALAAYKDMIKKYGPGYSAPKFQLHLAANAQ